MIMRSLLMCSSEKKVRFQEILGVSSIFSIGSSELRRRAEDDIGEVILKPQLKETEQL